MSAQNGLIYQGIVNDIQRKIKNGEFSVGDKLYSVKDICKYYNVSHMTSVRAINELKSLGLVKSVNRKGNYVNDIETVKKTSEKSTKKLKRIIVLTNGKIQVGKEDHYGAIVEAIFKESTKKGLEFQLKNIHGPDGDYILSESLLFEPDDGVIMVTGKPDIHVIGDMERQNINYVLVDSFIPGRNCILTNNHLGIAEIINHLFSLGHKHISMIMEHRANYSNEMERVLAFQNEIELKGLKGEVLQNGEMKKVFTLLKSRTAPTAFLFPQDVPAISFINALEKKGYKVPEQISVTGFDDYAFGNKNLARLTTIHVNTEKLGESAMELLLKSFRSGLKRPECRRINGKLIIRKSTINQ